MPCCPNGIFIPTVKDCNGNERSMLQDERLRVGDALIGYEFLYADSSVSLPQRSMLVIADASNGAMNVNLPPLTEGLTVMVKKVDNSNNVTIDGFQAEQIDGSNTYVLDTQYESVTLVADDDEWHSIGGGSAGGGSPGQDGQDGAPGGGITIPFTFSSSTAATDPGNGNLRLNNATQNLSTGIFADELDVNGVNWGDTLLSLGNALTGQSSDVRIFKADDPSAFLYYIIDQVNDNTGWYGLFPNSGTAIHFSSANPFTDGDSVILTATLRGLDGTDGTDGAQGPPGSDANITPGTTDNAIVRADGTSNDTIQGSTAIIQDTGRIDLNQNASLESSGAHGAILQTVDSIGAVSLSFTAHTLASANIGVGQSCLTNITTGTFNQAFGRNALFACDEGVANAAFGPNALSGITSGTNNLGMGTNAGNAVTTGASNTFIGVSSGSTSTSQAVGVTNSVVIGGFGFSRDGFSTAIGNSTDVNIRGVAIGYQSTADSDAVAIGYQSDSVSTYGVAIGHGAHAGENSIGIGQDAMSSASSSNSVCIGRNAGSGLTGNIGILIGDNAGTSLTTASGTICIGANAGTNASQLVSDFGSVIIGRNAYTSASNAVSIGYNSTAGANSVALGYEVSAGTNEVVIGRSTVETVTLGSGSEVVFNLFDDNLFMGTGAGNSIVTGGTGNTGLGINALNTVSTGDFNVAIGSNAGRDITTGASNVCIGTGAGLRLTDSGGMISIGINTTQNITTGSTECVALGNNALRNATGGSQNVAIGARAMDAVLTGSFNTGVGAGALGAATSGSANMCLGTGAGGGITTGQNNVAVGVTALVTCQSGSNNMAMGRDALQFFTGSQCTAIGSFALENLSTGARNSAIGYSAGIANQTSADNVFIGNSAGADAVGNAGVGRNVFIGSLCGTNVDTGTNNLLIGYNAAQNMTSGSVNVCMGSFAGSGFTTGNNNIAIGNGTTGAAGAQNNVFVGVNAGNGVGGTESVHIGTNSGNGLATTATAAHNVTIGDQAGHSTVGQVAGVANITCLGANSFTTGSNSIAIGSGASAGTNDISIGNLSTRTATIWAGTVINENGWESDTRIEGDTKTHMIFVDASAATENIALCATSEPNWQSMDGGLFIEDADTVPTGNPTGGAFLYAEGGELKTRDSSGNVNTVGGGGFPAHFEAYGEGSSYTLTGASSAVTFGTTSPAITITEAGTYRIKIGAEAGFSNTGGVMGICEIKARRTNNTAADLDNGLVQFALVSTDSNLWRASGYWEAEAYVTANTNDQIAVFARSVGTFTTQLITRCFIKAERIA